MGQTQCEGFDAGTAAGAGIPNYIASGFTNPPISNCFSGPINSTCTATVSQYATCIEEITTQFNTTVSGLPYSSCATVTVAQAGNVSTTQGTLPMSCTTIQNVACPGLTVPNPLDI